jgi:hypothetical protein
VPDTYSRRWHFAIDFGDWSSKFGMTGTTPIVSNEILPPRGYVLSHVNTNVGTTDQTWGVHHDAIDPTKPGESLANAVVPLYPNQEMRHTLFKNFPTVPEPLAEIRECWFCSGFANDYWTNSNPAWRERRNDATILVRNTGALPGHPEVGIMDAAGRVWDADQILSPNAASKLSNPHLRWVSPNEQNTFAGKGSLNPLVLGLPASLGEEIFALQRKPGARYVVESIRGKLPKQMSGRTNYYPLYVKSQAQLYIIGGVDSRGRAVGDVWSVSTQGGGWMKARGEFHASKVIAAVWNEQRASLWILDETGKHSARISRLSEVNTSTGDSRELGHWNTGDLHDVHWLLADNDGGVVLASSSDKLKTSSFVRFALSGDQLVVSSTLTVSTVLHARPIMEQDSIRIISSSTGRIERLDNSLFTSPVRGTISAASTFDPLAESFQ